MHRWLSILFVGGVVVCSLSRPAAGQWAQVAKLLPADGATHDWFGYAVAISGDVAVIGADWDADNGDGAGSAYIFRRVGAAWVQEAKLLAADGGASDHFGHAVAISGDVAVIGAYQDADIDVLAGSAYVFRCSGSTWVQEAKLYSADIARGDMFGRSVGVNGNAAVIGAHQDDDNGNEAGAAYIFRHDGAGWVQEAKLVASDGSTLEFFGTSVGISGDVVVVGTPEDDDGGYNCGSAYIFRYNGATWPQEAKLLAADQAAWDYFGKSVAVSGTAVVVGCDADDDLGAGSGSAYVFRYSGSAWSQETKLLAADGGEYDHFGQAVAVSGDVAVIGSPEDDDGGSNAGAAYVFRRAGATWVAQSKLLAADGAAGDWLGQAVAVSGQTAIVGTIYDDDLGDASGSAYIFAATCSGDLDDDGDVDIDDFDLFAGCWSGPGGAYPAGCAAADCDADGDVDLVDFGVFQTRFGM